MDPINDDRPPDEASRLLPILGRLASDGRVLYRPGAAAPRDLEPRFPNDPREA